MAARAGVVSMARLNKSKRLNRENAGEANTLAMSKQLDEQAHADVMEATYGHRALYCLPYRHPIRQFAIRVVESKWFATATLLVILINSVFIAAVDPLQPPDSPRNRIFNEAEIVFTVLFTIEMLFKITAMGFVLHRNTFLRDAWNWLDMIIVILGWLQVILTSGSNLSALRTFRVLRPLKTVQRVRGMRVLVSSLISAMPMFLNVMLLWVFAFSIFGIVGVQLWKGLLRQNCYERVGTGVTSWFVPTDEVCSRNPSHGYQCPGPDAQCIKDQDNPNYGITHFDHMPGAFLTIFQINTLEGWVQVMYDVSDAFSPWVAFYFIVLVLFGAFFIINLALAVIYARFAKANEDEQREQDLQEATAHVRAQQLQALVDEMNRDESSPPRGGEADKANSAHTPERKGTTGDEDQSNHSSGSQGSQGSPPTYNAPDDHSNGAKNAGGASGEASLNSSRPGPGRADHSTGKGKEAAVGTTVAVAAASKANNNNVTDRDDESDANRQQVWYTACYLYIQRHLHKLAVDQRFVYSITAIIVLNTVLMSTEHHQQPEYWTRTLFVTNVIFTITFTLELVIKVIGLGPRSYIRDSFNIFDAIIVAISLIELMLGGGGVVTVFRAFRLMRIFKIVRSWRSLRELLEVILRSLPSIGHGSFVLLLFMFIFTCLGMQLFGGQLRFENEDPVVPRHNFDTFLWALVTVFTVLTGENWNEVMYDTVRATNWVASLYFVVLVIIGNYILLNLFQAILLQNFAMVHTAEEDEDSDLEETVIASPASTYRVTSPIPSHRARSPTPTGPKAEARTAARRKAMEKLAAAKKRAKARMAARSPLNGGLVTTTTTSSTPPLAPGRTSGRPSPSHDSASSSGGGGTGSDSVAAGLTRGPQRPKLAPIEPSSSPDRVRTEGALGGPPPRAPSRGPSPTTAVSPRDGERRRRHRRSISGLAHLYSVRAGAVTPTGSPDVLRARDSYGSTTSAGSAGNSKGSSHHGASPSNSQKSLASGSSDEPTQQPQPQAQLPSQSQAAESNVNTGNDAMHAMSPVNGDAPAQRLTDDEIKALLPARSCMLFTNDSIWRVRVFRLITSRKFEYAILASIGVSSTLLALEHPTMDPNGGLARFLFATDIVFVILFSLEAALKIFARGFVLHKNAYLRSYWNQLDFFVVLVSIMTLVLRDFNIQFLRALRALRPLRIVSRNEGMKVVVNSLLRSIPAMINVILVCLLFWLIFGILGIQLFAGKFYRCSIMDVADRAECALRGGTWSNSPQNFDNIFRAMLTLFELSTLEMWPKLMLYGVDAVGVDQQPQRDNNQFAAFFYVAFIVVGAFFALNLFVGVVIDNFNAMKREYNGSIFLTAAQQQWVNAQRTMAKHTPVYQPPLPPEPDEDSGTLYRVWCHARRYAFDLVSSKWFEYFIMLCILVNILIMGLEHYRQSDVIEMTLRISNYVFTAIFTIEAMLKIFAYSPLVYVKSNWNNFDLFIVVTSLVGIIFETGVGVSALRVLRILRIFKLIKSARGLRTLLLTLFYSLPTMSNVGSLLLLLFFIYAVAGVSSFGGLPYGQYITRHANFEHFGLAMLLLFRMATGEDWNGVMHEASDPDSCDIVCGSRAAPIYFVTFTMLIFMILVNLFIAIILENFAELMSGQESTLTDEAYEQFTLVWAKFDPQATHYMNTEHIPELLRQLPPPLGLGKACSDARMRRALLELDIPDYSGHCLFRDLMLALASKEIGALLPMDVSVTVSIAQKWHKERAKRVKQDSEKKLTENNLAHTFAVGMLQKVYRRRAMRRATISAGQSPAGLYDVVQSVSTPPTPELSRSNLDSSGGGGDGALRASQSSMARLSGSDKPLPPVQNRSRANSGASVTAAPPVESSQNTPNTSGANTLRTAPSPVKEVVAKEIPVKDVDGSAVALSKKVQDHLSESLRDVQRKALNKELLDRVGSVPNLKVLQPYQTPPSLLPGIPTVSKPEETELDQAQQQSSSQQQLQSSSSAISSGPVSFGMQPSSNSLKVDTTLLVPFLDSKSASTSAASSPVGPRRLSSSRDTPFTMSRSGSLVSLEDDALRASGLPPVSPNTASAKKDGGKNKIRKTSLSDSIKASPAADMPGVPRQSEVAKRRDSLRSDLTDPVPMDDSVLDALTTQLTRESEEELPPIGAGAFPAVTKSSDSVVLPVPHVKVAKEIPLEQSPRAPVAVVVNQPVVTPSAAPPQDATPTPVVSTPPRAMIEMMPVKTPAPASVTTPPKPTPPVTDAAMATAAIASPARLYDSSPGSAHSPATPLLAQDISLRDNSPATPGGGGDTDARQFHSHPAQQLAQAQPSSSSGGSDWIVPTRDAPRVASNGYQSLRESSTTAVTPAPVVPTASTQAKGHLVYSPMSVPGTVEPERPSQSANPYATPPTPTTYAPAIAPIGRPDTPPETLPPSILPATAFPPLPGQLSASGTASTPGSTGKKKGKVAKGKAKGQGKGTPKAKGKKKGKGKGKAKKGTAKRGSKVGAKKRAGAPKNAFAMYA